MSNLSYFASRTPSATFSKSQNTARLASELGMSTFVVWGVRRIDGGAATGAHGAAPLAPVLDHGVAGRHYHEGEQGRSNHTADDRDGQRGVGLGAGAQA